jgi:hypothetical protein
MESKELTLANQQPIETIQERMRQTDLTIETATYWAKQLVKVVREAKLSRPIGNKEYLEVEGWLLISEFAHVRAVIEWVRPWKENDEVIGYEARCVLKNDAGDEVGAGESSCGFDAFPCQSKKGSEKDKAAKSAAQTWAISRALRNKFSFVAKLGGYQAVPAEEMNHDDDDRDHQAVPKHAPPPSMRVPDKPLVGPQLISESQRKRLWAICKARGVKEIELKDRLALYGFGSGYNVTKDKYDEICAWAEKGGKEEYIPPDAPPLEDEPPFPLEEPDQRLVR